MELKVTVKQLVAALGVLATTGTGGWFGMDAYNYVKGGVDNSYAITGWLTNNIAEKNELPLRKADALDCLFPIPANATPEMAQRSKEICPAFLGKVAERLAASVPPSMVSAPVSK